LSRFLSLLTDPEINELVQKLSVARGVVTKELDEAKMTTEWALKNLKALAESVDPKTALVAYKINVDVLTWHGKVNRDVPKLNSDARKRIEDIEDAEFHEEESNVPKKIGDGNGQTRDYDEDSPPA
jgi:hypothetical protein